MQFVQGCEKYNGAKFYGIWQWLFLLSVQNIFQLVMGNYTSCYGKKYIN